MTRPTNDPRYLDGFSRFEDVLAAFGEALPCGEEALLAAGYFQEANHEGFAVAVWSELQGRETLTKAVFCAHDDSESIETGEKVKVWLGNGEALFDGTLERFFKEHGGQDVHYGELQAALLESVPTMLPDLNMPSSEHHCRDFDAAMKTRHINRKTFKKSYAGRHPQTMSLYSLGHMITRNASDHTISFCPYCGQGLLHPWLQRVVNEKLGN